MGQLECRRRLRGKIKERTGDCIFRTLYALWDALDEMGEKRHVTEGEMMETRDDYMSSGDLGKPGNTLWPDAQLIAAKLRISCVYSPAAFKSCSLINPITVFMSKTFDSSRALRGQYYCGGSTRRSETGPRSSTSPTSEYPILCLSTLLPLASSFSINILDLAFQKEVQSNDALSR